MQQGCAQRHGGDILTYPFRPRKGHVIVFTEIWGPSSSLIFKLALDTGATDTMLNAQLLTKIGYDLETYPKVAMTTGSGTIEAPELVVSRIEALGQTLIDFPILAHTLPPTATIDGLLGLINFRLGKISVN